MKTASGDIRNIPEFQLHLKRCHINYATWQARQRGYDATSEALELRRQKIALNKNKG